MRRLLPLLCLMFSISGQGAPLPMNSNADEKPRTEPLPLIIRDASKAQQLDAGGEKFLALYRQASTPEAVGAVLLLPDFRHHPDWPGAVRILREELPPAGWSVLALTPPDLEIRSDRKLPDDAEWAAILQKVQLRVEAGLGFLRQEKVLNIVVIAQGWAGLAVLKIQATQALKDVTGLALLAPPALPAANDPVIAALATTSIPLAEIYPDSLVPRLAASRGETAKKQKKKLRRFLIPAQDPDFSDNSDLLAKSLRGWLKHMDGRELKPETP